MIALSIAWLGAAVAVVYMALAVIAWARPHFREWHFDRLNASAEKRVRLILKDRGLSEAEIEKKIVIGRVRIGFVALGCHEAMDWTDEQITQGTIEFARIMAQTGIDSEEAARGLHAFGRLASGVDDKETVH